MPRRAGYAVLSLTGVAAATVLMRGAVPASPTTVALGYLLVVLFAAAYADLWTAVGATVAAVLCFNFFFLPPVGTFSIADPQNWAALVAFLAVSIVASNLSTSARARAREAVERRLELTRLFDLTRDILLTTEQDDALAAIARHVARRFELTVAAIVVVTPPPGTGWMTRHGGPSAPAIAEADIMAAFDRATGAIEFDARTRAYGGHQEIDSSAGPLVLAPVRIGTAVAGLLATGGRRLESGARDAVAGIVAIAIERLQFLDERRRSELAHQRAELSSALLASLSHDLRTPLTAIRTAVSNLDSPLLAEEQRRDQARVASDQLARLTRLFDEILDMARIEARSVEPQRAWVTPAEIVEAGLSHAAAAIADREILLDAPDDVAVDVDPRLTSSALAHLIENAAQYAPEGPIHVRAQLDKSGLRIQVTDRGPGLRPAEVERLFEPFFRGESVRQRYPGTGMGLAITRGLLAAEGGRVWAENADGGARFTMAVPARSRPIAAVE